MGALKNKNIFIGKKIKSELLCFYEVLQLHWTKDPVRTTSKYKLKDIIFLLKVKKKSADGTSRICIVRFLKISCKIKLN